MTSMREQRLQERVAEVRPKLAKAREIAELAESENRAMTAGEQKSYDEIMTEGRSVADAVKAHRHDQEVFAFAKELSDNVIGGLSHDDSSSVGSGSKSRRLSFKGLGTKVATAMLGPDGQKALAPPLWARSSSPIRCVGPTRCSTSSRWYSTPRPSSPTCARASLALAAGRARPGGHQCAAVAHHPGCECGQ